MQRSIFIRQISKLSILASVVFLMVILAGCGSGSGVLQSEEVESIMTENTDKLTEENSTTLENSAETVSDSLTITEQQDTIPSNQEPVEETKIMKMLIGDTEVSVEWEDNESVYALEKLAASGGLTINMSMYGGFEQVGSLGSSLPRNDVQTTTIAGDIVLYSGNQIVVFYGSNSWAYTRLGKITDKTAEEMSNLLGNGDVTITIALD